MKETDFVADAVQNYKTIFGGPEVIDAWGSFSGNMLSETEGVRCRVSDFRNEHLNCLTFETYNLAKNHGVILSWARNEA